MTSADPYPAIERWVVPTAAIERTLAAVGRDLRDPVESGVFWLGPRGTETMVTAVAVPSGEGVVENRGRWRIAPEVFGSTTRWAAPRGLQFVGLVHTHPPGIPAVLSDLDRSDTVRAPGVLSIVIGQAGHDRDPAQWGWFVFENGDFRQLSSGTVPPAVTIGGMQPITVVRVDASGAAELP